MKKDMDGEGRKKERMERQRQRQKEDLQVIEELGREKDA